MNMNHVTLDNSLRMKNHHPFDRLMCGDKYVLSGGDSVYYDAKKKWIRCNGDILMSMKKSLQPSVCELRDGKMIVDGDVLYGNDGKIYCNDKLLYIRGNHIYYVKI